MYSIEKYQSCSQNEVLVVKFSLKLKKIAEIKQSKKVFSVVRFDQLISLQCAFGANTAFLVLVLILDDVFYTVFL